MRKPTTTNAQPTYIDKIAHGVTSTGPQRAVDIAARIADVRRRRMAGGAKRVECVFGEQGTLVVMEWY